MTSVVTPAWSPEQSCLTLRSRRFDTEASWVLELSGEANSATLGLLRQELAHVAASHRSNALVDVTQRRLCDVASAHMIRTARRSVPLTICGASGSVMHVFKLLDALQRQGLPRYLAACPPSGGRLRSHTNPRRTEGAEPGFG